MVVIIFIYILVLLFFIWYLSCIYLGYNIGFTILALVIVLLSIFTYIAAKEPTKQELKTFQEKRKGVGYV